MSARTFAAWTHFLAARRAWHERGYAADARMQRLRQSQVTRRWLAAVRESKRVRRLLSRALAMMRMRCAAVAFAAWVSLRAARRQWRADCAARERTVRLGNARRVLMRWREALALAHRFRRAVRTFVFRAAATAFRTWAARARARAEWSSFCAANATLLNLSRKRRAVARWQDARKVALFRRRVIGRLLNSAASGAFSTWAGWTRSRTAWRAHCADRMRAMRLRTLSVSVARWRESNRVIRFSRRVLGRILNRAASIAFSTWAAFHERRREWKAFCAEKTAALQRAQNAKVVGVWRESKRRATDLRRALARWQRSKVFSAVQRWRNGAAERIRLRGVLQRALARILFGATARSFAHWKRRMCDRRNWRAFAVKKAIAIQTSRLRRVTAAWREKARVDVFSRRGRILKFHFQDIYSTGKQENKQ